MEDRISSEQHWALDPSIQVYFLSAASVAGLCLLLGIVLNVVPIDESTLPVSLALPEGYCSELVAQSRHCFFG